MEIAVRAVDVSKHYDMYRRPADRLIELVTRRRHHVVFPALERVSFDVERGETVGIIGQNGAGKSTLLKLLCGVARPSSGALETHGTIASILELGTGFHPEFSGRDNAALNAAILGLTPAEVRERLPDILDFSELGSFIDRPVKTYSSGMYMRLAFSVAVNVDPEILVIDEALAVGDGHFQKKCIDKIRDFQEAGKTILFCSHALYYVSSICRRTLWLDGGRLMRYGPSLDVVHEYETFLLERDREHPASDAAPETHTPARFRSIEVCDRGGKPRDRFARGDDIHVRIRIEADSPLQPVHVIVGVHRSADDLQCFAVGTHADGIPPLSGRTSYDVTVRLVDVPLLRGDYSIIAYVGDEHAMTVFDRRDVRPAFSMTGDRFEIGLIGVDHRWELPRVEEVPAALDRR
ncbi:MAG TPA: ABC transporter ATP-binding protein [Thermoanaerobaculia bacterium]|jgi:ABC-type polysaccharide/polyol phosphate transport system ATPase subunit|nr:ABC transporter ATP-binding protein [Thermoanaerobaculia bacterium]